jgi:uncharacterized protein
LEGALPDAIANRIIEDEIAPHFRTGDYNGGLSAGVTAILQAIQGEYKGNGTTVAEDNSQGSNFDIGGIIQVIFFLLFLFLIWNNRRKGGIMYGSAGRGMFWGGFLGGFGGGLGGGFGGGGGGGGGFSGGSFMGGGGSFGGGGASGHW